LCNLLLIRYQVRTLKLGDLGEDRGADNTNDNARGRPVCTTDDSDHRYDRKTDRTESPRQTR